MKGPKSFELANFTRFLKSMFPDVFSPDHAVRIFRSVRSCPPLARVT